MRILPPMKSRPEPRRFSSALVLLIIFFATAASPQNSTKPTINHFSHSRLVATDVDGFYQMPTGIGDDYFDGTDSIVRIRRHMQTAKALGVKYLRCAFSWNGIEHQQGRYSWRFWDRLVSEGERFGIELVPYVAYTPEWAARSRVEYWKQPPRDPALFATFMDVIATRYRGRIKSWELWNEPDLREYWQGTPDEFAELIRQGAAAVRRADPEAVVVLGGMSRGPSPFFQRLIVAHHIADYVDVIAQHAYPESWDPERAETIFFDWPAEMQRLVASNRPGVDFWLNEIGYPDYRFTATNASHYGSTDVYYAYEHTLRYQGVFLFKSFVMALASGSSLTVWYRIDDFPLTERRLGDDLIHFHLGVLDAHGHRKPAFTAFSFYNRLFRLPVRQVEDSNIVQKSQNSKAIVNIFERKDSKIIVAAWLRSSERNEVRAVTGKLPDNRAEQISVTLPCKRVPRMQFFNPFGKIISTTARLTSAPDNVSLRNIPLRGNTVFIAVASCEKSS